ncbi:MAG: hypothetical protein WDN72_01335 [Alphaproteobacteria bacterium]
MTTYDELDAGMKEQVDHYIARRGERDMMSEDPARHESIFARVAASEEDIGPARDHLLQHYPSVVQLLSGGKPTYENLPGDDLKIVGQEIASRGKADLKANRQSICREAYCGRIPAEDAANYLLANEPDIIEATRKNLAGEQAKRDSWVPGQKFLLPGETKVEKLAGERVETIGKGPGAAGSMG